MSNEEEEEEEEWRRDSRVREEGEEGREEKRRTARKHTGNRVMEGGRRKGGREKREIKRHKKILSDPRLTRDGGRSHCRLFGVVGRSVGLSVCQSAKGLTRLIHREV